jgi:hypothetical protein
MTTYSSSSLYYSTPISSQNRLGTWVPPYVPSSPSDKIVTISAAYDSRPDLMAFDLYGLAELWYVFAIRNPGTLGLDPLGNFTQGTQIYIPDAAALKTALGL